MKTRSFKLINNIEYLITGFIFLILFLLPVLFTRIEGEISWRHVSKIWIDQFLLIPLFAINHWIFVPRLLLRKKYTVYLIVISAIILSLSFSYSYYDSAIYKKPVRRDQKPANQPEAIPPYANLLMYSLLITGVDTGLLFLKKWHENEEKKHKLEKENAEIQLNILLNQISPHFFMNTLNNIYALVDFNTTIAKEAVMKLSKLMRYIMFMRVHKSYIVNLQKINIIERNEIIYDDGTSIPISHQYKDKFQEFLDKNFMP